jgi:hypothetical protein
MAKRTSTANKSTSSRRTTMPDRMNTAGTSRARTSSRQESMDDAEDEEMSSSSDREESSSMAGKDYKSMIRELAANPAVRYVAGGIATAILTKVASNLSQKYPEISRFISENLENVEGKLGDFRDSLDPDSARQH